MTGSGFCKAHCVFGKRKGMLVPMSPQIKNAISARVLPLLEEMIARRPVGVSPQKLDRGQATKRRILDAAFLLFSHGKIEDFTMRNLARALEIRVGNLTYHFRTKADLLEAVVLDQVANYAENTLSLLQANHSGQESALEAAITFLVSDLRHEQITFFPQLWALALHDSMAAKLMDKIYLLEREVISQMIQAERQDWRQDECDALALHIVAAIEGLTLFIGRDRNNHGVFKAPEDMIIRLIRLILNDPVAGP